MTRGKERESTRVPSLGTEFRINASNNIINGLYKYVDPNDSIDFHKIETFIRNNFSALNPYKRDAHGELEISRSQAERIEKFTKLSRQINLLHKQGIEFYRDKKIETDTNNWIIRIGNPVLKSSCLVELDTLYLSTVSWKQLKSADETPTKLNERLININPTQVSKVYGYNYGYHPHINSSGQPCFGDYMSRLNDYAIQGSMLGYFNTIKQWTNTSNSRDAFWNLPALIRDISGRYMSIKKKRTDSENPYMHRRITYILPVKILLKMKDVFLNPFEGNHYFNTIKERIGRTNIDVNSFRELGQYYVNKYNRNPKNFKYYEEEILNRTRAYGILYALIRDYLIDSVRNTQSLKQMISGFNKDCFPMNRSDLEHSFRNMLAENTDTNSQVYHHVNSCTEDFADMLRTFIMEAKNAKRSNKYKFNNIFDKVMTYGWFRYKNINLYFKDFTENMEIYINYYFAAMEIDTSNDDDYRHQKVIHFKDLFKVDHWFSIGAINAFYKRLMEYKPAGRSRFLKQIRNEVIPSIYSYTEYEDVLIKEYWDTEPRLGYNLYNKTPESKIESLKYTCNIEEVFKKFNTIVNRYPINKPEDMAKLKHYIQYVVLNMLYDWTSHTFNVKAKEANHAAKERCKAQEGFKENETKGRKERVNDITEDVSENTVSAISV